MRESSSPSEKGRPWPHLSKSRLSKPPSRVKDEYGPTPSRGAQATQHNCNRYNDSNGGSRLSAPGTAPYREFAEPGEHWASKVTLGTPSTKNPEDTEKRSRARTPPPLQGVPTPSCKRREPNTKQEPKTYRTTQQKGTTQIKNTYTTEPAATRGPKPKPFEEENCTSVR